MSLTFLTANKSSFPNRISGIVSSGSNKEMVWINTCWVIAFMTYAHSLWNGSIRNLIRKAMSLSSRIVVSKCTISFWPNASNPKPTRVRTYFFHFLPKSVFSISSVFIAELKRQFSHSLDSAFVDSPPSCLSRETTQFRPIRFSHCVSETEGIYPVKYLWPHL